MAEVIEIGGAGPDPEAQIRAEETRLLLRIRDDADRAAFDEIFRRFAPKLKRYLGSLHCDGATSEVIVQDVMITVWTKAKLFDPDKASARTWMYTLVRNRMIDRKRSATRRAAAYEGYGNTLDEEADSGPGPATSAAFDQTAAFMRELPQEQAQILLMAYVEGKSQREIAVELDVPIGTVKSRARLAFQRLRKIMEVDV